MWQWATGSQAGISMGGTKDKLRAFYLNSIKPGENHHIEIMKSNAKKKLEFALATEMNKLKMKKHNEFFKLFLFYLCDLGNVQNILFNLTIVQTIFRVYF